MEIIVPAVIAHGGAGPGPKRQKNLEIAVQLNLALNMN